MVIKLALIMPYQSVLKHPEGNQIFENLQFNRSNESLCIKKTNSTTRYKIQDNLGFKPMTSRIISIGLKMLFISLYLQYHMITEIFFSPR